MTSYFCPTNLQRRHTPKVSDWSTVIRLSVSIASTSGHLGSSSTLFSPLVSVVLFFFFFSIGTARARRKRSCVSIIFLSSFVGFNVAPQYFLSLIQSLFPAGPATCIETTPSFLWRE